MKTTRYTRCRSGAVLSLGGLLFLMTACAPKTPKENSSETPAIFPDYKNVVVPCNIAPLNFMMDGASRISADFFVGNEKLFTVSGTNTIKIPEDDWQDGLKQARGKQMRVSVSVWNDQHQEGVKYRDFQITVSSDSITPWIAYRLIPPGYVLWKSMGIYQRHLENFEEECVVSNNENHDGCVNCHSFQNYSPERFLFHARGKNGCSVLVQNGVPERLELDKMEPHFKGTYPFWHPKGRFIVLANCDTHQAFYGHSNNKVEVYDLESDLMVYDTKEKKVITDPRFTEKQYWETFPAFSPDGKYLLFTESDSGTFPIWHKKADLKMINLATGERVNTDALNSSDVDSYHSWDQKGKWIIFSSRRLDGRYTRLFIAHFDEKTGFSKPFLLPQKAPVQNNERMYSYNIPEFVSGPVDLKESVADLFE